MPSVPFNFVRADMLRDDAQWGALKTETGLPALQEIKSKRPDWVVRIEVSDLQACQHALVGKFLIVSHCWESPETPDLEAVQLEQIVKYVKEHPSIQYVWLDYWCMPQGKRSAAEDLEFKTSLAHANWLYLGASVLLIVDMSYLSRFWTQYEAWLSMQQASAHGLAAAPQRLMRAHIVCIHSAEIEFQGKQLLSMWNKKSPEEAFGILRRPDVRVTNQKDKQIHLPKIQTMNQFVEDVLVTHELARRNQPTEASELDWLFQEVLSARSPRRPSPPFSDEVVTVFNVAQVNVNLKEFYSCFTDGTFAYLVPYGQNTASLGYVARVSLSDFSPSGVSFVNLAATNTNLKGYVGGFTDGSFAYFVPSYRNGAYHGYAARVSLSDFSDSGVSYINLAATDSNLKGFAGGFTDGTSAYYVPNNNGYPFGYVTRVSLSDFSSSGVSYLNLAETDSNLKGFIGGFTDGTYAYFSPYSNGAYHGNIARVLLSDFSSSGVSSVNLAATNANLKGFYGGFTDGSFAYCVPTINSGGRHGYVARVSLSDFSTSGVSYVNLAETNPNLKGFVGGFTDGSFAYFVPNNNGAPSGYVARVSLSDFSKSGVSYLNLAETNSNLKTFGGGFSDGTFGYFAPMTGSYVARIRVSPHSPGIGWKSSP